MTTPIIDVRVSAKNVKVGGVMVTLNKNEVMKNKIIDLDRFTVLSYDLDKLDRVNELRIHFFDEV